jgi:hypothetical protein
MWAEYADHDGLRAWARAIQSFVCYWAGQPRDAVRYAQLGADFATATRSTSSLYLFAGEARAWAALGNTEQATALIERAERARDQIAPDDLDEFGGPCTFGEPKLLYYAARALATLPEHTRGAETYAVRAVDAYQDQHGPDWDYNCQADSRVSLALARLASGDLDGAGDPLTGVFELPPEQRVSDIVNTISLVHRELNRFATDQRARDLQEQIELFTRTSLPRFPV